MEGELTVVFPFPSAPLRIRLPSFSRWLLLMDTLERRLFVCLPMMAVPIDTVLVRLPPIVVVRLSFFLLPPSPVQSPFFICQEGFTLLPLCGSVLVSFSTPIRFFARPNAPKPKQSMKKNCFHALPVVNNDTSSGVCEMQRKSSSVCSPG